MLPIGAVREESLGLSAPGHRPEEIQFVPDPSVVGSPGTIVNLRRGVDEQRWPVRYLHFPVANDLEKYQTAHREVRRWLNTAVGCVADPANQLPFLFHCASGKDRTGVVIASLLHILEVPTQVIIDEYLWSTGDVRREWIETALEGVGDPEAYFDRFELGKVRDRLLGG